ncbi:unnamed protein product, partial [Rotaria sordida]
YDPTADLIVGPIANLTVNISL